MESKTPNNDDKSFATIDFVVEKLSRLETTDAIFSEPSMIRKLPWKILILKKCENEGNSLGFFVQCNGESESPSWSCFARVTLCIMSRRSGIPDFSRKIAHVFETKTNDWGFSRFMSWDEVTDPAYGYIKNDTIILRAVITAYPPVGVDDMSDSKKENVDIAIDEMSDSDQETDYDILKSKCEENETKVQSLEAELSQLKKDLAGVKLDTKKLSEALSSKSAELLTYQSTITTLESKIVILEEILKSKLEEVDKKVDEVPTNTNTTEFVTGEGIVATLQSKINILEGMLQSKFGEMDKKINDINNQAEKEKRVGVDVSITVNGVNSKTSTV